MCLSMNYLDRFLSINELPVSSDIESKYACFFDFILIIVFPY